MRVQHGAGGWFGPRMRHLGELEQQDKHERIDLAAALSPIEIESERARDVGGETGRRRWFEMTCRGVSPEQVAPRVDMYLDRVRNVVELHHDSQLREYRLEGVERVPLGEKT